MFKLNSDIISTVLLIIVIILMYWTFKRNSHNLEKNKK